MNTTKLKLSNKESLDYCAKNQYASMMFFNATDDYIAARCCILNGLFSGFILACQSIEKILKSLIYLETGKATNLKRQDKHNPFKLKEELQKAKDYKLDKFDALLKRLFDYYQRRYYDNKTSGRGACCGPELDEIDKLWIYLVERMPIPDEVKCRSKFFTDLFDEGLREWQCDYYWIIRSNKALVRKTEGMKTRYKQVINHLYPKVPTSP